MFSHLPFCAIMTTTGVLGDLFVQIARGCAMKKRPFIGLTLLLPILWFACHVATPLQMTGAAFAQSNQGGADPVAQLTEELKQLRSELNQLKSQPPSNVVNVSGIGILAALVGFVASWLSMRGSRKSNREQLEQQLFLAREEAMMKLVGQLGDEKLSVRLASATLLLDQIRQAVGTGHHKKGSYPAREQAPMLLQVLVSATKEGNPDPNLGKVIGDALVSLVGARIEEGERPSARSASPLLAFGGEKLDLQNVKFPEVYWRGVDARGVDFYRADFTRAGLRETFLQGAIFYSACLKACVLRDADLSEANLQEANLECADLRGANLRGAVLDGANLKGAKVDEKTIWPDGFDYRPAIA
jgi:pentapeptide repeat protein